MMNSGEYLSVFIDAVLSNDVMACKVLMDTCFAEDRDALLWSALMSALYEGNFEIVKLFISQNTINIVNESSDDGWTALMAASFWDYANIAELLISKGADLNSRDYEGTTALIWASIRGNLSIVHLLLTRGANPNIATYSGSTASMEALSYGNNDIEDCIRKWPSTMAIIIALDLGLFCQMDLQNFQDIYEFTYS
jgi:ankyrin repeat protein